MKVKIVCVGKVKEKYFSQAIDEYKKRLGRFCSVEIVEVAEYTEKNQNPSQKQIETILQNEAKDVEKKLEGFVVVLDKDGQKLSSEQFAKTLHDQQQTNSTFTFVLGSSFGLSEQIKQRANLKFSFGNVTLPHTLARVVLTEQIYRAFMILSNSNYHK